MDARARARRALEGISVGDAFGERFFGSAASLIALRALPKGPWPITDDTIMSISVVEVLETHERIHQDVLAEAFARRWAAEPARGYGSSAHRILEAIHHGAPWWSVSRAAFGREGSKGNGGAMRAGPVGAWFADDLERCIREAALSAEVTHAHAEGQAGAIAVALATGHACKGIGGARLIEAVMDGTPEGETRSGLARALTLDPLTTVDDAVAALGNGSQVTAPDTVPFSVWCAAHNLGSYEEALWKTVAGLGDRDTTCAIVGGIVASAGAPIPVDWLASREPLVR